MSKIAFRASAKGSSVTRDTPRAAALAFFEANPGRRKCDVSEGETDGVFFRLTISIGGGVAGNPRSWRDVTPKLAITLPDLNHAELETRARANAVRNDPSAIGREAYEAHRALIPNYENGTARPEWSDLPAYARKSWETVPKPVG